MGAEQDALEQVVQELSVFYLMLFLRLILEDEITPNYTPRTGLHCCRYRGVSSASSLEWRLPYRAGKGRGDALGCKLNFMSRADKGHLTYRNLGRVSKVP